MAPFQEALPKCVAPFLTVEWIAQPMQLFESSVMVSEKCILKKKKWMQMPIHKSLQACLAFLRILSRRRRDGINQSASHPPLIDHCGRRGFTSFLKEVCQFILMTGRAQNFLQELMDMPQISLVCHDCVIHHSGSSTTLDGNCWTGDKQQPSVGKK